jgi:hypothetical protein
MDGRAVLERYHWLGGMIAVSSVCLPSIIAVELVDQRCDATSAATAHWRERANRLVGMIQNLGGLFRTGALDVLYVGCFFFSLAVRRSDPGILLLRMPCIRDAVNIIT